MGCERLRLLGTPLGRMFEAIILELSARRSPPARHIECLLWVNAQRIKIVWCYLAGQAWRRCKPSGKADRQTSFLSRLLLHDSSVLRNSLKASYGLCNNAGQPLCRGNDVVHCGDTLSCIERHRLQVTRR